VTPSRIEANFQLDGWSLTDEEVSQISAIKDRFKVCDGTFLPDAAQPIFDGKDE
jgi:glycerol 2-dehydrogenase (NADP+)